MGRNLSVDYQSAQKGQNEFNVRNEVDKTAKEQKLSVGKRVIWHFDSANLFSCPTYLIVFAEAESLLPLLMRGVRDLIKHLISSITILCYG